MKRPFHYHLAKGRALGGARRWSVLACVSAGMASAATVDFARQIQPILAERCVKCHGPEKQRGGLRLDSKAAAFRGGDSGEAGILPGQANRSPLFQRVTSTKNDERMPPTKNGAVPLSAKEVELLRQWIDGGAHWPQTKGVVAKSNSSGMKVTDEDRKHWSFLPFHAVTPPAVKDAAWVRTPVDRFIRQAQESKGLAHADAADARTLVRRMYFDLIGLPPTPEELEAFVNHGNPSELIDKLLASPRYGERWARHWLDVARYADSNGQESDHDRPNAYRFRDFVIRALNDDMPFDQFVRWQLAGDELSPDDPLAIAATGFIVAGVSTIIDVPMEEEKLRLRADELDDMVSTTGQALLGLTFACARCHDHKYDPIPTRDYYSLMRVFNAGDRTDVPLASQAKVKLHRDQMAAWQRDYDALMQRRDAFMAIARMGKIDALPVTDDKKRLLKEKPDDPDAKYLAAKFKSQLKVNTNDVVAALKGDQPREWEDLEARINAANKRKPPALPAAFAFADFAPEPRETWFFERGNYMARNEKMNLGFLSVLSAKKPAADYWREAKQFRLRDDSTQQRSALAKWITDADAGAGALLARVIVNRVWQHHFGEGLVRTVSDFGTRGEQPAHPELLEWLTREFVRSGWGLKHLHRLIMNSAVYQQSIGFDARQSAIDPENRLLWHRRPLRLEAEALRDSMLAAAGTLNPAMFGKSVKPPIVPEAMQARNVKDPYPKDIEDSDATRRRSLYLFHKRVVQYPLMQAFDAPDAGASCGRRMNTTVAPQALALLNDPFVRMRAEELAARLTNECGGDATAMVRRAFQLCLGREPARDELEDSAAFIRDRMANKPSRQALADFCQSLFGLNEFIYID